MNDRDGWMETFRVVSAYHKIRVLVSYLHCVLYGEKFICSSWNLTGIDGVGLGLIRHHEKLAK
jgi:hypothetical protein